MKFLDLKKWTKDDYLRFFERTSNGSFTTLNNKSYAILFFENSTRTHYSFVKAVQDLGGTVLEFDASTSAILKGESFHSTIKTFDSMKVDGIVIRSSIENYWDSLGDINAPIINAGDGSGAHPSQALLDMYTAYKHFDKIEGLKVLIMGDIKHSRVARTNMNSWRKVGSTVHLTGPESFKVDDEGWIDSSDLNLGDYDIVMLLRVQNERFNEKFSIDKYNNQFGLNVDNLSQLKKEAIIMHPGPFNLGVELTDDVLQDSRCKIWDQVESGVEVRKMILTWAEEYKNDKN